MRLPSYRELAEADPPYSSWKVPGFDPRLGTLSLLNEELAAQAAKLAKRGAVFRLDAPIDFFRFSLGEHRKPAEQVVVNPLPNVYDEHIGNWNTQSSSQWDGFLHIAHPVHGFYGGLQMQEHGIDHWARHGIVARGVLADVGRYREAIGRPLKLAESDAVEIADITGALATTGTELRQGDILLIRTGWLEWYQSIPAGAKPPSVYKLPTPGLRSSPEVLEFLWDAHVAAVAADNQALEVWPPGALAPADVRFAARTDKSRLPEVFMHYALLPLLGIPIGELWRLGGLAADCAADGVYEFMLCSAPVVIPRGVASPPNAVAIK